MDNPFESPVILSLCPGVLGLERGLERAIGPVTVAAYVEIETVLIANLVTAMEQNKLAAAPIWSDIKTFCGEWVRGKIHGIIGGYPCQPFSTAGARNGTSDPRHLYPFISGIIQAAGPVWCFFENVEGHLSLGYPEVSADLRSMGYAVEAGIYSAEEVGAPHQRGRLFILAIKWDWLDNAIDPRQGVGWTCGNEPNVHTGNENYRSTAEEFCGVRRKEEMGNTSSAGQQECGPRIFSKLQTENGKRIYDRLEQSGINEGQVAHPDNAGDTTPGSGDNALRTHSGRRRDDITQPEPGGYRTPPGRHLLADTEGPRLEGCITEGSASTGRCAGEYDDVFTDRWPARPGEQQHPWECPRTITDKEQAESGMGGSTDGYNFREDLLRAYGNSVVEQTAEIAFIDLLNKHFDNYKSK